MHAVLEDLETPLAGALRSVHGDVSVSQEPFGRRVAGAEGDTDARVHDQLSAVMNDRRREGSKNALGDADDAAQRRRTVDQHRELVTAQAGRRVRSTQATANPLGHLDEHGVADRMPETVVDHLEVVEIDRRGRRRLRPDQRCG